MRIISQQLNNDNDYLFIIKVYISVIELIKKYLLIQI